MKTAKRVLAVIIAVIMIVGTCAVAASAAETLQSKIDAAAAGDTVTMTKNTTESVTINKNITLDLGGYQLTGDYGKAAITIKNADVTVTNGQVEAMFKKCSTMEMIKTVSDTCPPAISLRGGNLVADGVRLVGGMIRVPTTPINDPTLVAAGSGIMAYSGATVTLKRATIIGDYGVNNAIRTVAPGGLVTVEDAIILAYNTAVKGQYEIAEGSEEIIAADRIAGILNDGITLEPKEKEIAHNVLDDRTMIVVKTPETLTALLGEETPTITVTADKSSATADAAELDYTWENTSATDCSYTLVPERVKYSNGVYGDIDTIDPTLMDDDAQIVYRALYKIGDNTRPYMERLLDEGLNNPLDGALGWAGLELNKYYKQFTAKNNNNEMDTYDEVKETLGDLLYTIDKAGATKVGDVLIAELDEFATLRQKLYSIFGVAIYEASAERKASEYYVPFDNATYQGIFGENMPADGIVGTFDRVEQMKTQLETIIGGSFTNTAKYDELAAWVIDTVYPELIANDDSILKTVIAQLQDLKATLEDEDSMYPAIVEAANVGDDLAIIDTAINYGTKALALYEDAMENVDVRSTIDYVLENKDDVVGYVEKFVHIIENWRTYVTPEEFIIDDTYVKTFSLIGPMELIEEEAEGNLHIIVSGSGTVSYTGGGIPASEDNYTTEEKFVGFNDYFTLTATADDEEGTEFLFWANRDDGAYRILSTEPEFTMYTNSSRTIEAVFNKIDKPSVWFTNPTGGICFNVRVSNFTMNNAKDPYVAGYSFTGWPVSAAADLANATTSYFAGNSVFADPNAYYGPAGAVMKVRADSTSFIVTPKYSIPEGYNVKFIDNGETYEATGNYSDVATFTSTLGADAYWVDRNTGEVVCVNATFPYSIIDNATFESRQGAAPETVMRTIVTKNGSKNILNIERSTKKAIATTGIIYIVNPESDFSAENDLKLDLEGVKKGTAKFTTQTGTYSPSFSDTALAGKTIIARPYIEFVDGSAPFYGDLITFVNGVLQN